MTFKAPQRVESNTGSASSQRVVPTTSPKKGENKEEPNYVSDDEDEQQRPAPTLRRSSRLRDILSQERPDRPDNVPHRIVALVESETAEVPRLVIQQKRYARGFAAANLEL